MLSLFRIQAPPMVLGHSFRLSPLAAERLRQSSAEDYNRLYSDMAFGCSPGFMCGCCGLGLDDYCNALAALMLASNEEPDPRWTTARLLRHALRIPCERRSALTTAALRGQTGTVLFDVLSHPDVGSVYTTLRTMIGVALDESITALGGDPPRLLHR